MNDCWVLLEVNLAMLAVDLVTSLAFKWHVWELLASKAADLIDQFSLKLILNFIEFDINRWDRFRAHDLLNSLFWDHKVKPLCCCVVWSLILLCDDDGAWVCCNGVLLLNVRSSWAYISIAHSDWGSLSTDKLCWSWFHIFK